MSHRLASSCRCTALVLGLVSIACSAFAQGFCETSPAASCFDFEQTEIIGAVQFGVAQVLTGSEEDGYLSITDSANWQSGAIVFPPLPGTENLLVVGGRTGAANSNHHIDNLEIDADGDEVRVTAEVRIGGGTRLPADGFSINFVRPDDPVLDNGEQWAEIAAHQFPEEGAQTGLAIGFDEWAATEPWDVPAISVRYDDVVVKQFHYPEINGNLASSESLQTGPNQTEIPQGPIPDEERTQSLNVDLNELAWTQLLIDRTGDDVTIQYKENIHYVTLPSSNVDCSGDRVVLANDIACSNEDSISDLLRLTEITPGDFDLNGIVEFQDFLVLAQNFGSSEKAGVYANGDTDLNGAIEFLDFLVLSENFGETTTGSVQVPEPSGSVTFAFGLWVLLGCSKFHPRRSQTRLTAVPS